MAHKQNSAADKALDDFKKYIGKLFIDKFDKRSCTSYETVGNCWRVECEYSAEAENFLILQSRTYLRNLDRNDSKSQNPSFLGALTSLMADFLSAYTMRSGTTRRQAEKKLKKQLYTENPYIINLLAEQDKKRKDGYKRTPENVAARRKKEAAAAAKQARELHRQVMGEFTEVSTYRRKR